MTTVVRRSDDWPRHDLPATVLSATSRSATVQLADGGLATLLSSGRDAGPRSCVLRDETVPWSAGDVINALDGTPAVFATRLVGADVAALREIRAGIMAFVETEAPGEALARTAPDHPVRARMRGLLEAVRSDDEFDLEGVHGFGPGATPSSDDWLLGVLAVLDAFEHPRARDFARAIQGVMPKLAPLSALMLRAACAGRYPEAVLHLLTSPGPAALKGLAEHGGTSGFDVLLGVHDALRITTDERTQP